MKGAERIEFRLVLRRGEVLRYLAIDRFIRARYTWILVIVVGSLFNITAKQGGDEPLSQSVLLGILVYPAFLLLLWMVNSLVAVFNAARMCKGSDHVDEGSVDIDAIRIKVSNGDNSFECMWKGVVTYRLSNWYLLLNQPGGIELVVPTRLLSREQIEKMRVWWRDARA
jgi:hypothetical protein